MKSLENLVQDIISELAMIQILPEFPVDEDDVFPLPRMIPTSDGGAILITRKIDELISTVARQLLDDSRSLKERFTIAEFNRTVRDGFGPSLSHLDLDEDINQNAATVLAEIKTKVSKKEVDANVPCEYCFGCTLFRNEEDVSGFCIGPVRFERRLEWLDRKLADSGVSKVTRNRLARAWSGETLRSRKASRDSLHEDAVRSAIGACPYICSVRTNGFGREAGEEKALAAARLALASIALLWRTPSRALEGFNLLVDRSVRRQVILPFVYGKKVLPGSRLTHMPHGPAIFPDKWETICEEKKLHFAVCGEVVDYWLSANGNVNRPQLMNTLAQSLLWFHEGCRESVNLMAIVKFAASLDALSGGRKAAGIRSLIKARLEIDDGRQIFRDEPKTLKGAIDEIYGAVRSRTLHGTNDKFGYDWSVTRGRAEILAKLSLASCIEWAGMNPKVGDACPWC